MDICLVLQSNIRFLDILAIHVLSICMIIDYRNSILMFFSIFFIHMFWLQLFVGATYSNLSIICKMKCGFMLKKETYLPPRKNVLLVALSLLSILSSQSSSVHAHEVKSLDLSFHSQKLDIPFNI